MILVYFSFFVRIHNIIPIYYQNRIIAKIVQKIISAKTSPQIVCCF
nr:MAG TPA: hypothetical protein [Caudoviricetes sp.]